MKTKIFALLASALLVPSTLSWATINGLPDTTGTSFSTWDTFTSGAFTGAAAGASDTGLFSATLDSASGGQVLNPARLYSGAPTTFAPTAFNLTLNGTAAGPITTLSLIMKFTSPGSVAASDFFNIALTGVGAANTQLFLGSITEGANTFNIFQWTWTGLNIAASSNFAITAISTVDHASLDTIRLSDTAAVPEPSSALLIGLALASATILRRRK